MQTKTLSLNIALLQVSNGYFLIGVSSRFPEPAFFRNSKQKFHIDVKVNLEDMKLEAIHDGKVILCRDIAKTPTYDDYCDLFIDAVRFLTKRKSIVLGYSFILE